MLFKIEVYSFGSFLVDLLDTYCDIEHSLIPGLLMFIFIFIFNQGLRPRYTATFLAKNDKFSLHLHPSNYLLNEKETHSQERRLACQQDSC